MQISVELREAMAELRQRAIEQLRSIGFSESILRLFTWKGTVHRREGRITYHLDFQTESPIVCSRAVGCPGINQGAALQNMWKVSKTNITQRAFVELNSLSLRNQLDKV